MRLVKEKNGIGIDGVSHVKPQLLAHLAATIITLFILMAPALRDGTDPGAHMHWLNIINTYLLGGMGVFWIGSEFHQEYVMVKDGRHVKGRHWKFWTWSQSRWQDIVIPELAGGVYTGAVYLLVFLLYKFI